MKTNTPHTTVDGDARTHDTREWEQEFDSILSATYEMGVGPKKEKALKEFIHHQLQKAREKRKGWKGYVAVDPKADNYKYSPVFSDRKGAELWVKGKEISGLEVVEVDIFLVDHSELDQPNK